MLTRKGLSSVRLLVGGAVVIAIAIGAFVVYRKLAGVAVSVTTAEQGPVVQAFYSTGTVQPEREYPIKSNTAGILTEVKVDKGARVKKGDVLAIVSDPALQYAVDKAKAELNEKLQRADEKTSPVLLEFESKIASSGELLQIAQRETKRLQDAMAMNASSQSDLDVALDRLKRVSMEADSLKSQKDAKKLELQREVDVAKAALATAQWNLDEQTLKAPVDGVVLDRPTAIGTRVAINEQIMRVADVAAEKLVMRAAVDEEDVTKVLVGQAVRMSLYAFEGNILSGKVTRIYDQADAERRTFEVEVSFDDVKKELQPGMTGELVFILKQKDIATVLPSQALQKSQDKEFVYVVNGSVLKKVQPKVGLRSIERVEILEGVQQGEWVILTPIGSVDDGTKVRITERLDPKVAAGLNKPPPASEAFKGFQ